MTQPEKCHNVDKKKIRVCDQTPEWIIVRTTTWYCDHRVETLIYVHGNKYCDSKTSVFSSESNLSLQDSHGVCHQCEQIQTLNEIFNKIPTPLEFIYRIKGRAQGHSVWRTLGPAASLKVCNCVPLLYD